MNIFVLMLLSEKCLKKLKGMSVDTVEIERSQKISASLSRQLDQVWLLAAVVKERLSSKDLDMLLRTQKLIEKPEIKIDIEEIRSPESSANIVGQMIAEGLEKRLTFRRVMKQTIEKVMANRDVEGVRIISFWSSWWS